MPNSWTVHDKRYTTARLRRAGWQHCLFARLRVSARHDAADVCPVGAFARTSLLSRWPRANSRWSFFQFGLLGASLMPSLVPHIYIRPTTAIDIYPESTAVCWSTMFKSSSLHLPRVLAHPVFILVILGCADAHFHLPLLSACLPRALFPWLLRQQD